MIMEEYEKKESEKILKKLRSMKDHLEIVEYSFISSSSGIGQNIMFKVIVRMHNENFGKTDFPLYFDITDYKSW